MVMVPEIVQLCNVFGQILVPAAHYLPELPMDLDEIGAAEHLKIAPFPLALAPCVHCPILAANPFRDYS